MVRARVCDQYSLLLLSVYSPLSLSRLLGVGPSRDTYSRCRKYRAVLWWYVFRLTAIAGSDMDLFQAQGSPETAPPSLARARRDDSVAGQPSSSGDPTSSMGWRG